MSDVRLLTLNLLGRKGGWEERRPLLVDGFMALTPDVVMLQEVVTDDDYDQAADLLGPEFEIAHQRENLHGGGYRAASIASRWPLGEVHDVELPTTPRTSDYPCGAIVAEVLAPPPVGRIVVAAHGPSYQWYGELERERQSLAVARRVEAVVGEAHAVVAGDFNAVPDSASMRFWTGLQSIDGTSVCYEDAWRSASRPDAGDTFSPGNPLTAIDEPHLRRGRRVDYVLVRCTEHGPTLEIVHCALAFDKPVDGVWASDHFGVLADLDAWR